MASQVRVGAFIYRINPANDKELQRRSFGSSSWSRVTEFNGYHILDLLLADNGKDIEVYTDRYVYVREYSGNIRKKYQSPNYRNPPHSASMALCGGSGYYLNRLETNLEDD